MTRARSVGFPGNVPLIDDAGYMYVKALPSGTTVAAITETAYPSGSVILCGGQASGYSATLPAPKDGLNYTFYVNGANSSNQVKISAPSTGQVVAFNDSAADAITLGNSSVTSIGLAVTFFSDGTKWYTITSPAASSAAPATATMGLPSIQT